MRFNLEEEVGMRSGEVVFDLNDGDLTQNVFSTPDPDIDAQIKDLNELLVISPKYRTALTGMPNCIDFGV